MSTKIYNGFRYIGGNGLFGCYQSFDGIRDKIDDMAALKCVKFLAETSADIIDRITLSMPDRAHSNGSSKAPLWQACAEWDFRRSRLDEILNAPMLLDPSVDTSFKVSLFPLSNKTILGIPYINDWEWESWFFKKPFISKYGYWNSTDRPDAVGSREWKMRQRRWDIAFKSVPNERSMDMDLSPQFNPKHTLMSNRDIRMVSRVAKHIEPVEIRAKIWADNLVIRDYTKKFPGSAEAAIEYVTSEGLDKVEKLEKSFANRMIEIDEIALIGSTP